MSAMSQARWASPLLALALGALLMGAWGCASTAHRTQPNDMSAQNHRRAAGAHQQRAGDHQGQFDAKAREESPVGFGFPVVANINSTDLGESREPASGFHNPTAPHEGEAQAEREHASEHLRAASALEAFTDARCHDVSTEARETSPLIGAVSELQDLPTGVRLLLSPGVAAEPLLQAVRCHQAFARERHFEGAAHCPLYLSSVDVVLEPAGDALRITTKDDSALDDLRTRSRHMVAVKP